MYPIVRRIALSRAAIIITEQHTRDPLGRVLKNSPASIDFLMAHEYLSTKSSMHVLPFRELTRSRANKFQSHMLSASNAEGPLSNINI